jgi:hypothetical protein
VPTKITADQQQSPYGISVPENLQLGVGLGVVRRPARGTFRRALGSAQPPEHISHRPPMKSSIHDLLWLTVFVALVVGWWVIIGDKRTKAATNAK